MLSDNEKYQAGYINLVDTVLIQNYIDNDFVGPITAKQIYAKLKDQLTSDTTEAMFCSSLSCNVRGGYITGAKGFRKVGYKKIDKVEPLEKPEPEERRSRGRKKSTPIVVQPQRTLHPNVLKSINNELVAEANQIAQESKQEPKVLAPYKEPEATRPKVNGKLARHLWIGNKCYHVACYTPTIEKFVENVLDGTRSGTGNIVIDGKRWNCSNVEVFEKFLTKFNHGKYIGDMEPVITSSNDVPVELLLGK